MRKIVLAAATLGILAAGGAAARADWVEPGVVVAPNAPAYYAHGPVYEGRNVYVVPNPNHVYADPWLNHEPAYQRGRATFGTQWVMPGDQNIINQERANDRSN